MTIVQARISPRQRSWSRMAVCGFGAMFNAGYRPILCSVSTALRVSSAVIERPLVIS